MSVWLLPPWTSAPHLGVAVVLAETLASRALAAVGAAATSSTLA